VSFTEPRFAVLLLVTYAAWRLLGGRETAKLWLLLCASAVFYGDRRWGWLVVLAWFGVVDWAVGRWIARASHPRPALLAGLVFNLGVLACLKLAPSLPAAPSAAAVWGIPAGVSFYSFIGVAYMIDVYRRAVAAEPSPLRFGIFVGFFPHLVAGPILRAREFLPALQPGALPLRTPAPLEAAVLLGRGYFKKMVLADRIGVAVDPFFAHVAAPATDGVWALPFLYLYAFQIYFDFSGYTDIARGLALLFGFRWPENFALPYAAASVRDFWRRWHITLSTFLRDYVYVPLGGSRRGALRTHLNLAATLVIGGLWHGAGVPFLLWGAVHALYLSAHRLWTATRLARELASAPGALGRVWQAASVTLTFHCVCLAWSFFRLPSAGEALACLWKCVAFDLGRPLIGGAAEASAWTLLAAYAAVFVALRHAAGPLALWRRLPLTRGLAWGGAVALFLLALLLSPSGEPRPFIYFRF
jgi:alginate O-acetyltransferase complex protein AlgI